MEVMEWVYFAVMVLIFVFGAFKFKLPISLALGIAAVSGAVLAGEGISIRHLVEGMFGYLNTILIIAMAMIFMKVIQYSGLLDTIVHELIVKFHFKPVFLLLSMMGLVMFPGMITGSSTAAVLTTGALAAPVLTCIGIPRFKVAAFIAMGAIYGMIAPPINVPAMIIGGGIDMPYVGFGLPLLMASLPLALITAILIGFKHIGNINFKSVEAKLPASFRQDYGFKIYFPLIVLIALMMKESLLPHYLPNLGLPLIFLISSLIGIFTGRKFNFLSVAREAIDDALPVMGILMGVGMFIQIMTLNGVRGTIVIACLSLPSVLLYLSISLSMPLFGAVSSFGSASVLGVPFILALLGHNEIITASALALISGLGDLMPPTALAGMFAAQVIGEERYYQVLKKCIWPAIMTALYGVLLIMVANPLNNILKTTSGKIYLVVGLVLLVFVVLILARLTSKWRKEGEN